MISCIAIGMMTTYWLQGGCFGAIPRVSQITMKSYPSQNSVKDGLLSPFNAVNSPMRRKEC